MTHFGLPMQQSHEAPAFISALLDDVTPKAIVEFGTGNGGLTVLLGFWCKLNCCRMVTWDNARPRLPQINDLLDFLMVETRNADYFAPGELGYAKQVFQAHIGKCLVICDGGNKSKELATFGPMLSIGDVIMAHDYAPSQNAFQKRFKDRIWGHCEICNDSIPSGFEIYAPEMAAAAWICLRHS